MYDQLDIHLSFLSVLGELTEQPLVQHYRSTLESMRYDITAFGWEYGALCRLIYSTGDIRQALLDAVRCDENALNANLSNPGKNILDAATHDLAVINGLLALSGRTLLDNANESFPEILEGCIDSLPVYPASDPLPFATGEELADYYRKNGYGFFARANAFVIRAGGELMPVSNPDPIRLSDLPGYERQKKAILTNTLAFLAGQDANNILLYGDKGTGKSSTVKAIVNEYASRGLKIVELPPKMVSEFPKLCERIAASPFHFIVFLDDLSFVREDDNFAALKAFIEGGLAGKPENMVIYATSNRRHLVRESFSSRQGDDIHLRDTLETATSLSDRFGLEVTFSVPDRDEYLFIVDELAAEYGVKLAPEELHLLAERFALRRNGRSPRTARQFISQHLAEVNHASQF